MKRKITKLLILSFMLAIQTAFAQQKTVSGTVIGSSPDGGALPGVNVLIKGAKKGTQTDFDGKYSIKVKKGDVLIFSFQGMKTVQKTVGESAVIDLTMAESENLLGEVIVTASGVSREKKALGYSAKSLGSKEISISKTPNPLDALQGKVSGVDISAAPGPGATQNVIIRGASSFGNNQPLYIVDGVPITNDQNRSDSDLNNQVDFGSGINAINPDDIANITVLKGAAATALYGSRAANGVIMITTKSGKNTQGELRINYRGNFAFTRVGYLPEEQTQFGQGWSGDMALEENGNWGAAYDGKNRVWGRIVDNSQKLKPYLYLKNRVRDFYELGHSQSHSLSLSGGNATTNFYLSLSRNKVDGPVPTDNDSYTRHTVSMKGSHQSKKIKVQGAFNVSSEKTKAIESGQNNSLIRSLYEIANDISIVDLKDYKDKFNNLDNYFTPYGVNPYFVINENGAVQQKYKFYGKFQIDYNILENLKVQYAFGGDFETATADVHHAIRESKTSSNKDPGSYSQTKRNRLQMNHDLKAFYDTKLFEDLNLNAIVGFNTNERRYNALVGEINSIYLPNYYNLSNSLSPSTSTQRSSKRRLVGVYYSADLSYKNYAFLNFTARNDWSSTLPKDNNSFFYAGQTFSFIVSDYLKSKDIDTGFMNFAKVRIAYGTTGNDAAPYSIAERYVAGVSSSPGFPKVDNLKFPLGGINSFSASNRLPNPDLKPEKSSEFETGLETQFFKNRLGLGFSYYNRLTKNLIQRLVVDPSTGYTNQLANLGDIRNKGIEFDFNATPLKIGDFSWSLNFNYSSNDNLVEKLDVKEIFISGFGGAGIYAVEGKPLGQFKIKTVQKTTIDGVEHTIVDGKGMPIATVDQQYIGKDINEDYRMGLTNTFSWKGIVLSATLDYRKGGYIFSRTKANMHWTGSGPETVYNDRKPFVIKNSVVKNPDGTFSENTRPVSPTELHTFYNNGGFTGADFAILDRSYIKLRNVNLRYSIPTNICEKIKLKSVVLSLSASNILLWTPKGNKYIDPETTSFGNDISGKFGEFSANPPNQTYTFGVNINL